MEVEHSGEGIFRGLLDAFQEITMTKRFISIGKFYEKIIPLDSNLLWKFLIWHPEMFTEPKRRRVFTKLLQNFYHASMS